MGNTGAITRLNFPGTSHPLHIISTHNLTHIIRVLPARRAARPAFCRLCLGVPGRRDHRLDMGPRPHQRARQGHGRRVPRKGRQRVYLLSRFRDRADPSPSHRLPSVPLRTLPVLCVIASDVLIFHLAYTLQAPGGRNWEAWSADPYCTSPRASLSHPC